ncbi:holin [Bacillus shivajii]|uniref:holin n=1 Tax=Bacillus shivajii TaxID=1983719 RepID=UPI001CFA80F8|nr:holin [Bacillus shivajii]UCZ54412.1 holin [Bacillus shivajii]
MDAVLMFASILSPIVVALVELLKRTVNIPKNFIPLSSFIIGMLVGIVSYPFTELEFILRIWAGGICGLSAVGLFEIGKYTKSNGREHTGS